MDTLRGKKAFNKIVLGFVFHLLGGIAGSVWNSDNMKALVCLIGWFFIINGFSKLWKELRNPFRGFYRILFGFYIFLCLVMIVRGYLIDYPYQWFGLASLINFHLFEPTYILCYLMPFVTFIPNKYYSFKDLARYSVWGYAIFVVVFIVFFRQLMYASALAAYEGRMESDLPILSITGLGVSFILLCWKYLPPKQFRIVFVGFFIQLLAYVLFARRGAVAIMLFILFSYVWTYFERRTMSLKIPLFILLVTLGVVFFQLYESFSIFSFIKERGFEDTRTGVEVAMLNQMSYWQRIFGEGLNGRYYYPMNFEKIDIYKGWRYGVETGFYNIVLKGGYLMAYTYILLLFIPAVKGIFKSNNLLCKVGGLFILLSLIELYPHGWLTFSVKFLIIWMCILLCMSKQIRELSDIQIYERYFVN